MEVYIVRDSDGQTVATAEVIQSTLGLSSAEPQLAEGYQVEVVKVAVNDLLDVQNFYASKR
jgi:hypothetical protein